MTTAELLELYEVDDPADLEPVPKGYELIDGELVEKPDMGAESGVVLGEVFFVLRTFLGNHPLGVAVTGEAGYCCFPDRPGQVRKPDVSVILCDPAAFTVPRGHFRVVPDLVVEVVSPHDTVYDTDEKVHDFLRAGTKLVWVVNPVLRAVLIHRADGTLTRLQDPAELTGEDVLPGFTTPLAAFLPRGPAAQPPA
jgi:Uma2 family endonuclease